MKQKPTKKPGKEIGFEERVRRFNKYYKDPEQFYKIFSELGFSYVNDECNGNCPKCKQKDTWEVYSEVVSRKTYKKKN